MTTSTTSKSRKAPPAIAGSKTKTGIPLAPGTLEARIKRSQNPVNKARVTVPSVTQIQDYLDSESQQTVSNGQQIPLDLDPSSPCDSQMSTVESPLNMSVVSGMPEWALDFQREFRLLKNRVTDHDDRLITIESLTAQVQQLTASLQASEAAHQEAKDYIAVLERRLAYGTDPSQADQDCDMVAETDFPALPVRDLSSNGSKYAGEAPADPSVKTKVAAPKKTAAQIAAMNLPAPKKSPAKKNKTAKQKVAAVRPFLPSTPGPKGFKYVFIPRSRKMTRVEVRSRFRHIGVDTSRVLDIIFPASGVIGVLLHIQYVKGFTDTMEAVGAKILSNFDVLSPEHLGDPKYMSYTQDARENMALELHNRRCISALEFLHNTKHHQVSGVGRSFIELGWITDHDLVQIMGAPKHAPTALKRASVAGAAFRSEDMDISGDGVPSGDVSSGGVSPGGVSLGGASSVGGASSGGAPSGGVSSGVSSGASGANEEYVEDEYMGGISTTTSTASDISI